jgi:hypothetical protein
MPKAAATMVNQVRVGKRWPKAKRASKAVNKGPKAMMTNTLATLVKPKANIKAVNITAQHTPDTQKARDSGKKPQCRCKTCPQAEREIGTPPEVEASPARDQARHSGSIHNKDSAVKALR